MDKDMAYIIICGPKTVQDVRKLIMPVVESVWSTAALAESAVRYYESLNKDMRYNIIERPLNALHKR